MANKKAASNAKKPAAKKSTTKTKVTTVKATQSRPSKASKPATVAASPTRRLGRFNVSFTSGLVAEFVGTFIFAGAFIAASGQPLYVLFALVGVMLAVGTVAGGYVNPALTIASWVTRRMSGLQAVGYIAAQILGAMLALVVLTAFVNAAAPSASPNDMFGAATAPQLYTAAAIPAGHEWLIFLSEFIGTLILGFVVASAAVRGLGGFVGRGMKAMLAGFGMFLGLMLAGSAAALIGGTAVLNPAVAISLEAINFSSVWPILVYVVGSSLGAIVGFLLFDMVRRAEVEEATA